MRSSCLNKALSCPLSQCGTPSSSASCHLRGMWVFCRLCCICQLCKDLLDSLKHQVFTSVSCFTLCFCTLVPHPLWPLAYPKASSERTSLVPLMQFFWTVYCSVFSLLTAGLRLGQVQQPPTLHSLPRRCSLKPFGAQFLRTHLSI